MKKAHEDPSKDIEMGVQNVANATMWVENELSFQTRDLESFLKNKSDIELQNAAAFAEDLYDAEMQQNKDDIDMEQCLEWFDEDFNEAFNFTSEFAEEVVREVRPNRTEQLRNHKKILANQQKKDELLINHSNKLLEAAERQKSHFRKTVKKLEQELQDTYNNWEASEINNREEMVKIRAELESEKKKNLINQNKKVEVRPVPQKCKDCKFTCKDSKTLDNHVGLVHSNQNCHLCEETFTSKAAFRNHVRKHLTEYKCEVCYKKFTSLDDAKSHGTSHVAREKKPRRSLKLQNQRTPPMLIARSAKQNLILRMITTNTQTIAVKLSIHSYVKIAILNSSARQD